jgi:hypothetical protein
VLRIFERLLGHGRSEDDGPDPQSRETGGVPNPDAADQGSTTGTTPSGEFVGRVAGQDVGYAEETGAERRAKVDRADG